MQSRVSLKPVPSGPEERLTDPHRGKKARFWAEREGTGKKGAARCTQYFEKPPKMEVDRAKRPTHALG